MKSLQILEPIGAGSQGKVFRAFHTRLGMEVAVKKMEKPHIAQMEIDTLKYMRCKSPYIVEYIDHCIQDNGDYWIIMEYVSGINGSHMVDLIQKGIFPTEKEIAQIVYCIASAIERLHDHELIYGDIKPANFIYLPSKHAKLVDFGCTRAGPSLFTPVGTPPYFAPEKFHWDFGYASDVWALGVMLYVLLSGIHPFVHQHRSIKDKHMLEHEILTTPLTFHHPRWDSVSPDARDIISGMLIRNVKERMTIEDVLQHPWFVKMSVDNI